MIYLITLIPNCVLQGTLAQLCGGKHKNTLPGRTYSMLSRGATHTQLVGGHRSSLSCGAKDIPLHLQRLHRQTSVPVERNLPPIRINTLTQPMKPRQCSPINVLAKRLRLLPRTTGNHTSIDSANTISNSSLQDLDDPEFTGSELAHYMGELNNRWRHKPSPYIPTYAYHWLNYFFYCLVLVLAILCLFPFYFLMCNVCVDRVKRTKRMYI